MTWSRPLRAWNEENDEIEKSFSAINQSNNIIVIIPLFHCSFLAKIRSHLHPGIPFANANSAVFFQISSLEYHFMKRYQRCIAYSWDVFSLISHALISSWLMIISFPKRNDVTKGCTIKYNSWRNKFDLKQPLTSSFSSPSNSLSICTCIGDLHHSIVHREHHGNNRKLWRKTFSSNWILQSTKNARTCPTWHISTMPLSFTTWRRGILQSWSTWVSDVSVNLLLTCWWCNRPTLDFSV